MPDRINRVVSRHGDQGKTSLADGKRYDKFSPRVELVGVLDEANAALGMACVLIDPPYHEFVVNLQSRLFDIGAAVATGKAQPGWEDQLRELEQRTQEMNASLQPLKEFVLPGSNEVSTRLHLARTTLRRAERLFWRAANEDLQKSDIGAFLNRASDCLFVLGRVLSDEEVLWQPMTNEQRD